MYDIIELNAKKVPDLKEIAKKLGVARAEKLKKQDLVYSILDEQALQPTPSKPKSQTKPRTKAAPKDEAKAEAKADSFLRAPRIQKAPPEEAKVNVTPHLVQTISGRRIPEGNHRPKILKAKPTTKGPARKDPRMQEVSESREMQFVKGEHGK